MLVHQVPCLSCSILPCLEFAHVPFHFIQLVVVDYFTKAILCFTHFFSLPFFFCFCYVSLLAFLHIRGNIFDNHPLCSKRVSCGPHSSFGRSKSHSFPPG